MSDVDLRTLFDSQYIGAWDLQGRDAVVTIEKIVGADIVGDGGKTSKKPLIYFKGKKKPLILNKTNLKALHGMYGTFKTSGLIGKKVTLFATTCRGAAGGTVDCVRIKPTIPKGADSPDALDQPVDPEMRAKQVVERQPGEEG
jgi:hypothetical protein